MMLQEFLSRLLAGKSLSERDSQALFAAVFQKKLTDTEAKSLLVMLAEKGETVEEVAGCLKALRKLEPSVHVKIPHLIDMCGTGGDQSHTFNISTVAALVVAGAGGHVAKHGNRALSSKSGSSDLLEALGVKLSAPRARMIESIRRHGIGYFHAPLYHPIFSRVQPLRRALKIRTVFNLLGPLVNPLKLEAQVIGVAKKEYVPMFAKILQKTGLRRALICHSEDGLDELSTTAPASVAELRESGILVRRLDPGHYEFLRASKRDLRGGSPKQNARLALAILEGRRTGPLKDTILLNAAAGLWISHIAATIEEGIWKARLSLESGKALDSLSGLIRLSRKR